jgi:tetratricopeptide (TPR) repeat protein
VSLLPEKEKKKLTVMRTKLSVEDVNHVKTDLGDWLNSVNKNNDSIKSLTKVSHPIRNTTHVKPTAPTTHGEIEGTEDNTKPKKGLIRKEEMSTKEYFESWAKFSEKESEDSENEVIGKTAEFKTTEDDTQAARRHGNLEMSDLRQMIANNEVELPERKFMSTREREKGNEYFKSGENEKAWHCYSKSVLLDPSNAKSFANRATVLARLGRREEAIQDCTEAINIDPTYVKAVGRRGMIFHQMQRFEEAVQDFELCTTLDAVGGYARLLEKSKAKLLEELAKKSPKQETKELKIEEFDSSDENDDVIEEVYTPGILQTTQIGHDNEGLINHNSSSMSRWGVIDDVDSSKPAVGNESNGNVCKRDGSQSWQKISIIDTSDSDDENNGDDPERHLMRRVEIVVEDCDDEDFDSIEATGSKSPNAQEKSESCKEAGNEALSAKRYDKAISLYTKALDLDPKNTAALNNRSLAYIKTFQYDKAITDATDCLASEPSNIKAMYRRGLATMMCSKKATAAESARSDFETALTFNPPKDQQVLLAKKLNECEMLLKSLVNTGTCGPEVKEMSTTSKSPWMTKRKNHDTAALCF